jgi:N-glycosylase/DNA lyase
LEYKGLNIIEGKNKIEVSGIKDFNPTHIFECGQCFRWNRQDDGSFTGVAKNRVIKVRMNDDKLEIENSDTKDFIDIWYDYFDLGTDYSAIKEKLKKDVILKEAVEFGYGMRILRQDIWETLMSFILSANNRIPMIMRTVDSIAKRFGEKVEFDGKLYYLFPESSTLAKTDVKALQICGGGFRCKYLDKTIKMVNDGIVDLTGIENMDTDAARNELKRFPGVGNKVADCTLLYSAGKHEVFPTDVWVKRIMEFLYFGREATMNEIQVFSKEAFGGLAGYAQQYLFYYARENRLGCD